MNIESLGRFPDEAAWERRRANESAPEKRESESGPNLEFFITDHSLRHPDMVSNDQLRAIYREMKQQGISFIRFDWDWDESYPERGKLNQQVVDRYIAAMKMMREEGLKAPSLVLSTPPEWAVKLYQKDKESYFAAYREYLQTIADAMAAAGLTANYAQLANEINNPLMYQFFEMKDFSRIVRTAKEVFFKSQPEMKFTVSVIVSNFIDQLAKITRKPTAMQFLDQYKQELSLVDFISLDYYPGMWHYPVRLEKEKSAFPIPRSVNPIREAGNIINRTFKDISALQPVCEKIADWGMPYDLSESGFPTNYPYSQGRRQRMFYDMYLRSVRQMLEDFHRRGVALPQHVGFYETQDEPNRGFGIMLDKVLNAPGVRQLLRLTPFPEGHFGLRNAKGEKKEILKGRLKQSRAGTPDLAELSQLHRLINYVNRPFAKDRFKES
jgi:hypothetical protein